MTTVLVARVSLVIALISRVTGSCPVVSRDEWGARPPRLTEPLPLPVRHVVIHHTYIPPACHNATLCRTAMRAMQDMHQIANGWNDIGYSFCVGGDGLVYQGRGWNRVGAHAPRYNDKSIGICLIGDFRDELPSPEMLQAVRQLIACGVESGVIAPDYLLLGHKQVRATECPGGALFREIQTWPHFFPMTYEPAASSTTSATTSGSSMHTDTASTSGSATSTAPSISRHSASPAFTDTTSNPSVTTEAGSHLHTDTTPTFGFSATSAFISRDSASPALTDTASATSPISDSPVYTSTTGSSATSAFISRDSASPALTDTTPTFGFSASSTTTGPVSPTPTETENTVATDD